MCLPHALSPAKFKVNSERAVAVEMGLLALIKGANLGTRYRQGLVYDVTCLFESGSLHSLPALYLLHQPTNQSAKGIIGKLAKVRT